MQNLILNTDSHKTSHFVQYPQGAEFVSSYIESRGGVHASTVFFGLQMFIKQYLTKPITLADIDEAEMICAAHGVPFNRDGWMHILTVHNGYLPLEIEAVPEGTEVPTGNVLVQVINTDPTCAWLTSYIETALLRAVWYPTTVATVSKACQNIIAGYLDETADNLNGLPFKLHDFGARGASSEETTRLAAWHTWSASWVPITFLPWWRHAVITVLIWLASLSRQQNTAPSPAGAVKEKPLLTPICSSNLAARINW